MTVIGAMGGMDMMDMMDAMDAMDAMGVMGVSATIRAIEMMIIETEIVGFTRIRANAASPTNLLVMTTDRLAAISPFDKRPQRESAPTGALPTHGMMLRIALTINNTI